MKKILAIDLGKFNSAACVLETETGEIRFQRIASNRSYFKRLLERERPDVVIFEACAMAGWVYDVCREGGIRTKVANTCAEAWKFKHLKRKTDRDDAERLEPVKTPEGKDCVSSNAGLPSSELSYPEQRA